MARYFLRFRHSDTGLTPTFTFFKKASDLTVVTPPAIGEAGFGTYYFDYTPTFDIVFEADGGASIPTEEVRYISDTISPKDTYVDEPTSQVKDDVWNDATNRALGTKGDFVEHIGLDTDAVDDPTVFGKVYKARDAVMGGSGYLGTGVDVKTVKDTIGAWADNSLATTLFGRVMQAREAIRGDTQGTQDGNDIEQVYDAVVAAQADLTDIKGVGFATGTDSLKILSDVLGTPAGVSLSADVAAVKAVVDTINTETDPGAIANAVWNEVLTTHITANSGGDVLNRVFKILKNRTKINTTTDKLTVYDNDGTTVLYEFDLKDDTGAPSGETPFERVPA